MDNTLSLTLIILLSTALVITLAALIRTSLQSLEVKHAVIVSNMKRDFRDMRTDRDNNRRAAEQAAIVLENRVNTERLAKGLDPFPIMAAVIPEHNSPVSPEQESAARFATIRARITAASLALGEDVPEIDSPRYKEEQP